MERYSWGTPRKIYPLPGNFPAVYPPHLEKMRQNVWITCISTMGTGGFLLKLPLVDEALEDSSLVPGIPGEVTHTPGPVTCIGFKSMRFYCQLKIHRNQSLYSKTCLCFFFDLEKQSKKMIAFS